MIDPELQLALEWWLEILSLELQDVARVQADDPPRRLRVQLHDCTRLPVQIPAARQALDDARLPGGEGDSELHERVTVRKKLDEI